MTILFASDWSKYPTAIIDTKTKNTSFIRLASVYKKMGIKNHAFILALHNPLLQGVDPHDPNITPAQAAMVVKECYENFWYYIREVARAPAMAGDAPTPFLANRANIALFWSFFNHILFILIQPRQTGKSFSTDTLMRWLIDIRCRSTHINLLTKDDTLRRTNIQRIKDIGEELPAYLQFQQPDDAKNGEEITVNLHGNRYQTHVPQASEKRAMNMGRGLTSPIIQADEGPFQANFRIALPAALAALGAATDRAKASNAPYGTILTTTAGKKDDKDGKFVYQMLCRAARWNEVFFDCPDLTTLEAMVLRAGRGDKDDNGSAGKPMINGTFSHRQLGLTDEWLRGKILDSMQTGDEANRDYFNIWTSGGMKSPLPIAVAERVGNSRKEIQYTEVTPNGYLIRWYITKEEVAQLENHPLIVGCDTSELTGGDDTSLVIVDQLSLEVLGCATINDSLIIRFSEWVATLFTRWKRMVFVPEYRSTGGSVIDYLLVQLPAKGINPFKRIFNRLVHEADIYPERYKEIELCTPSNPRFEEILTRNKKFFGFPTSGNGEYARSVLYGDLVKNCGMVAEYLNDTVLIEQILGLVEKNGRIDHEVGEHDDMVIGWLLANWFLNKGKNLSFYGIDSRRTGYDLRQRQSDNTDPYDTFKRMEQQLLRQEIEAVFAQLVNETDEYVSSQYEHKLRTLNSKLILEDDEVFSMDELIKRVRDSRKGRIREKIQSNNLARSNTSGYQTKFEVTSIGYTRH